ncbi:MAG: bifunctional DNA-formamidopyrimidine glycosylase/DNA-(apurinic or apyrimidinic site) lyase [Burkholderiaceae bacterium]|jgi:formamidopyrimidine-DNA glycosylase|nr:bifunctional DNA-formamidopyrimidine glycosylase/DNA-(apurinic or apyrimidinic site) lyase [Burkholderiaceae bacterium]
MPELPEVEVTRRSFADGIEGAVIAGAWQGKPLRWPLGAPLEVLTARTVQAVRRRGKYLLLHLDQGVLLIHLGMSGSLLFGRHLPPPGAHDHFDLHTSGGTLRLHDPRRFGAVVWADSLADPRARKLLERLGAEPLDADFDLPAFHAALRQRRAAIKSVLLAGDVVVGAGNIYACEALFLARIHPATPAARLSWQRAQRLHAAIRQVLQQAIELGGSSLRDFSSAAGESGHFQLNTSVYGRAGQPCHVCASAIRQMRQGQRSTYFCARCQHF